VPAPGTAGRYAGIEPHPTFQIGGDLRLMYYQPIDSDTLGRDSAFFPMQADLYLAVRPYNPPVQNEGRLTLLLNTGFLGAREEKFDGIADRFFVREYYAMYHDLPYQLYVRAGRFLPAFGWKTDDHTPFVRQGQRILSQTLDHEGQVTGVEVGINPNYVYAHLSVFNSPDLPMTVSNFDSAGVDPFFTVDGAYGTALAAGWRDLAWHAGGSLIYGHQGERDKDGLTIGGYDQIAWSVEWAVNFDVIAGATDLPLTYIGQYVLNHRFPEAGRNTLGLAAMHQVDYLIARGLNALVRYDWADPDAELKFDSVHRVSAGFDWHPYTFAEVDLRYRHNWTNSEERFDSGRDEIVLILHGWY
ncbi:MAG: hypothetical protein KC620_19470, partial [Myxococcales bacterium]|nr:hypothetical protein [Myxococcales bacterium]